MNLRTGSTVVQYKWVVLSNTTMTTLMASLDVNIVLIALPTIGRDLPQTSLLDLLWVLLGYNLVVSSALVNFGRLADMFGRVRLYNLGFAVFTIGSALCSLSQTGAQLIAFRLLQGVGGAVLIANSTPIITDTFPIEERGKALGINRMSQVLGVTLAVVVGGLLTTLGGWRSIFWVNIPIGVFGTIWSHYKLRELGVVHKGQKVDLIGNITFVVSLTLLLAGVSLYSLGSLSFLYFVSLVSGGAAAFILFILVERQVENPMLDLALFKIRPFTGGTLASFLSALARGCVLLVMTSYLQGPTMELNPLLAGIFLLPNSIGLAFLGPISGWLSDRGDVRFYATLGLVITFVGLLMMTQIGPTSDFLHVAIPLLLIGSGQGIFSTPNRASVMNSVPPQHRGVGSAVNSTMLNVGNTFSRGFAFFLMSLVLPAIYLQNLFAGKADLSGGTAFLSAYVGSLQLVFYVCAALTLVSIIPSIMRGQATADIGTHRKQGPDHSRSVDSPVKGAEDA